MNTTEITVIGHEMFTSQKGNEIKRIHWLEPISSSIGDGYKGFSCYVDLKTYNELVKTEGKKINAYVLHRGPYNEILGLE